MKLFLVRHGQTQWNASQRYQGHTDVPLNDVGRQQARSVADYLYANEPVEAVYCSDLQRARETASIIASRYGLVPIPDPRLREFCFGVWEGLTFSEIYARYREDYDQWYNNPHHFTVPGGECFQHVVERSHQAVHEIISRHQDSTLIVTHGGVIKAILLQIEAISTPWQDAAAPGSLTRFHVEDGCLQVEEIGQIV